MITKKIILTFTMLLLCGTSFSMDYIRNLFESREMRDIQRDIDTTKADSSLNPIDWHNKLSELHYELHEAYMKNVKRTDFDESRAMNIFTQYEEHKQAALKHQQTESKVRELREKISQKIKRKTKTISQANNLIIDYQELVKLCPENEEYRECLQRVENWKLRKETEQHIVELKEINNKKGLLVAYGTLIKTFKADEQKAPYLKEMVTLQFEIAAEEKKHQEELERAAQLNELDEKIDAMEKNESVSVVARAIQLTSLFSSRAKLCREMGNRNLQAFFDSNKAKNFRFEYEQEFEALQDTDDKKGLVEAYQLLLQNTLQDDEQKMCRERIAFLEEELAQEEIENQKRIAQMTQYNELTTKIRYFNQDKKSDLECKRELASLLSARANIGQHLPSQKIQTDDDVRRSKGLLYESLTLANKAKDTKAAQEIFALLTQ